MKTKLITLAVIAAGLIGPSAFAQEATTILFVPSQTLEGNRTSGKLKDNTFHWTNFLADPKQGPTVAKDGNTQFLLVKGAGTQTSPKANTVVTLMRAFTIPEGAKYATITSEARATYDEWIDNSPKSAKSLPSLTYSFVKDGKEARADSKIDIGERNDGIWKKDVIVEDIPVGAQQLVIVAKSDFPSTLAIAGLNVAFSATKPEEPKKPSPTPAPAQ